MARRCLFSFGTVSDGYFLSNGKRLHASSVPASLIEAINEDRLRDLKSISIDPNGGWIVCYNEAANGGPDGDNYYADDISKPLQQYLSDHAHEDKSNPMQYVKVGPDGQFFVQRCRTLAWQMSKPLQCSMKKLQKFNVEGYLEEIVFGPDDTAVFIFGNGSFLWDLPLESNAHELLQRCYAVGNQLEAAALSFASSGDYFFFWGHSNASYCMPSANHAKVQDMVRDSCMTRMHYHMLQTLTAGPHLPFTKVPSDKMQQSPTSVLGGPGKDNNDVCDVACTDLQAESMLQCVHQLTKSLVCGPREGNGNLRTWSD